MTPHLKFRWLLSWRSSHEASFGVFAFTPNNEKAPREETTSGLGELIAFRFSGGEVLSIGVFQPNIYQLTLVFLLGLRYSTALEYCLEDRYKRLVAFHLEF